MKLTAQNTYPKIQIEQLTQSNWNEQEKSNAILIADFMQNLMNEHNFDYVLENYNNYKYIQLNRGLENSVEGLVKYVKKFTKQFPEYSYDIRRIIASGDYIVFHSHVTIKAKHRGNEKKGFIISEIPGKLLIERY